ncbi:MAG: glycosyltransferase [Planctomycetes bacterium]|nr:glycosyltransferase [Planctomycetota bacterium]
MLTPEELALPKTLCRLLAKNRIRKKIASNTKEQRDDQKYTQSEQNMKEYLTKHNKISVITPCYNAERYIQETIESVVRNTAFQRGLASLQYTICDGVSTDKTLAIADEIFSSIDQENVELEIISEPDAGMYDALAKGLQASSGDIMCYINAGDFYSPTAFEIVLEVFNSKQVKWLTGINTFYNENSHLVGMRVPFKYRPRLIQCGLYNEKVLPFIQQESTFWHSNLNILLDYDALGKIKYAGDYYMWKQFSKKEQLYIVQAWLGGFKAHHEQLTSTLSDYYLEMDMIQENPTVLDYASAYFDKPLWYFPSTLKKKFNKDFLYRFDPKTQKYQ